MANYQINLSPEAHSEIRNLPGHIRGQLRQLIPELAKNPRSPRAKELRGKPNIYRIWLAKEWRVVYEIDDELSVIYVLRVRRKSNIDYETL